MDLQRLFLFLIFSVSSMLVWENWQRAQHPAPAPVTAASGVPAATTSLTAAPAGSAPATEVKRISGAKIVVKTDNFVAEINTVGGDLRRLELAQHRDAKDKAKLFVLMQEQGTHSYLAQTGLLGAGLPTHNSLFSSAASEYQMAAGQDSLEVRLTANDIVGATVTKIYTFHRGSYVVDVGYEIQNTGAAPMAATAYFQLVRDSSAPEGDSKFVPTYTGPAVYTDKEKFQKVDFSNIEKSKTDYPKTADNGWVGMLQHYFVSAWLPKDKTQREYYTKALGNDLFAAGVIVPVAAIAPGQAGKVSVPLYAGPAQAKLDDVAPGLGLTVDYGWLTIIATPIFWLLTKIQSIVTNWGVAIILLTVLIKLAFFPLSAASYRSMAKMRVVAPKLEKIKERYGDDRERLHKEMMELYKTEKINPLGGCLPMLIQIPVFIALYWSILSSVEMRHAPFFAWITDLSTPDPFYVLPLIMAVSMFLQSKLNPTPADPLQAKMMQIMPLVFAVVFFWFPAGLVLYSVVNNVLSIAQQWYITRSLESATKVAANDPR
ncbi:Membrane protein insertase YidC [Ferriphaselus amnicola]|uniref:Membrane protein insertase YidC n=1 Tax=Ferriphaselus amnicola TaxID=1188319 RepID=A0A2Z6G890_9PROT|nr:membrane protein insertase YidC [Ferriphaselus amnicola]BBE49677.1 Membrane protein insertase YidC [Ferriphaselus amnicola]